jgi:hypothetical protein
MTDMPRRPDGVLIACDAITLFAIEFAVQGVIGRGSLPGQLLGFAAAESVHAFINSTQKYGVYLPIEPHLQSQERSNICYRN